MSTTAFAPAVLEPDDAIVFDPATADDIPTARTHTHLVLLDTPFPLADNTALIVSELVGNAVQHGGPRVTFTVRATPAGAEVEVTDEGDRTGPGDTRPDGEHGLGLLIVRALSDSLTVDSDGERTTVRVHIRTPQEQTR